MQENLLTLATYTLEFSAYKISLIVLVQLSERALRMYE